MARVKTFTNGGGILPGDLNAIQDDYEYAFSTYKTLLRRSCQPGGGTTANTYGIATNGLQSTVPNGTDAVFQLNATDRSANSGQAGAFNRTVYYRIRAEVLVGSTAPGATFNIALQRPSAWSTASSTPAVNGFTSVTGSVLTFTTPAANSQATQVTADFTLPAADYYYLAFSNSANTAAASVVSISVELQYRQA